MAAIALAALAGPSCWNGGNRIGGVGAPAGRVGSAGAGFSRPGSVSPQMSAPTGMRMGGVGAPDWRWAARVGGGGGGGGARVAAAGWCRRWRTAALAKTEFETCDDRRLVPPIFIFAR